MLSDSGEVTLANCTLGKPEISRTWASSIGSSSFLITAFCRSTRVLGSEMSTR